MANYTQLAQSYTSAPVTSETLGTINNAGLQFLSTFIKCQYKSAFLLQQLSLAIQRFNVVAIQGTVTHTTITHSSDLAVQAFLLFLASVFDPWDLLVPE